MSLVGLNYSMISKVYSFYTEVGSLPSPKSKGRVIAIEDLKLNCSNHSAALSNHLNLTYVPASKNQQFITWGVLANMYLSPFCCSYVSVLNIT